MAKKQKSKKTKERRVVKESAKPKAPGVIATILACVQHGPVSKEQILAKLQKKFPDRPVEGMAKTIQAQLPNRMSKEKGVEIVRDKDGNFYVKK